MKLTQIPRFWTSELLALLIILAALVVALSASAAEDLNIQLTAHRVFTQTNGQEQLAPAQQALPGDIVQYDALYQNRSNRALRQLQPILPIPAGMEYVPDSARPEPTHASLDGRRFEPIPLKRSVTLPTGQVLEEEVAPGEYRALRWSVGNLAASATTNVVARTRVAPVGSPSPRDPRLSKN